MNPDAARYELKRFAGADELAQAVAAEVLARIEAAASAGAPFHIALSGGRISQNLFRAITTRAREANPRPPHRLDHVHFFWADERCLPPEDPESNFKTANELLFLPLQIPATCIHRIPGEQPPEVAALTAEQDIQRVVSSRADGQPVLDLILLGLGEDGHTASLFPNDDPQAPTNPAVYRAIHHSPKPPPFRVTLGFRAIAAAKEAWMIASGSGKETALKDSLAGESTPFGKVLRMRTWTQIFSDIPV